MKSILKTLESFEVIQGILVLCLCCLFILGRKGVGVFLGLRFTLINTVRAGVQASGHQHFAFAAAAVPGEMMIANYPFILRQKRPSQVIIKAYGGGGGDGNARQWESG